MATPNSNSSMPTTETPTEIFITLLVIVGVTYCFLLYIFESWSVPLIFLVLALTTEVYTVGVDEFHAVTLLNALSGKQRTVFQGRSAKLPWEKPSTLVDLHTELKDISKETWATKEGAQMNVKYTYLLHPKREAKAIITFASFEPNAVKMAARNLFTMMLSDHFGKNKPADLLKKAEIGDIVFGKDLSNPLIKKFEDEHGVSVNIIRLEDVDYDEDTQKARNTITKAQSIGEALRLLIENGMSKEVAEKTVRMLNISGIQEHILEAKGFENLTSVVWGGTGVKK